MVLLLSALFSQTIEAEPTTFDVTFTGRKIEGNDNGTNVYDVLKGMEPGDSADIVFVLNNSSKKNVAFWMKNDALRTFEEDSFASNGAYTYELTYTSAAGNELTLYSSNEVGGEKTNPGDDNLTGLHEATEALKDYFFLEEYEPGQGGRVTLHVELEGETPLNSYQETLAKLQFVFATEVIGEREIKVFIIPKTGVDGVRGNSSKNTNSSLIALVSLAVMLMSIIYLILMKKKDKKHRNAAVMILLLLLVIPAFSQRTQAERKYQVTLLSGNHGKIINLKSEQAMKPAERIDLYFNPGEEWNPNDYKIIVNDNEEDSRYFVLNENEFHISGIEGTALAQQVYEDMVFVATYRIKGDLVRHTVNYVDEEGVQLLPSEHYYGNVGEEAVLAYQYINGYLPRAYNLAHVLEANPDDDPEINVFTFEYVKLPEVEPTIRYEEGEAVPGSSSPGQSIPREEEAQELPFTPEEIIDIDDPSTPTTNPDIVDPEPVIVPEPEKESTNWLVIILSICSILLLFLLLLLFLRRRKEDEEKIN